MQGGVPLLLKCQTGVKGLDEITDGGIPRGRPTLVCGGTGCGKTLLGMDFVIRGIVQFNEPGVFFSFEEKPEELIQNYASFGVDLEGLTREGKLVLEYVHIDRTEIEEAGDYDLEGLFVRLGHSIDTIGAQRVVIDTLEALFSMFANDMVLRAELRRLFAFLKGKGVTTIVTGETGAHTLTRFGLEEYVADCVIALDHTVKEQIATRRLRIVKYRGSSHGTNEYPFLIDHQGLSILPITSLKLDHPVSTERISTGIARLDNMLGGQGFYRGSSVLITGTAGTGKSSLAAHFVDAACRRGERAIYFAFEESQNQIIRNMRSIGIDLEQWVTRGLLTFHNTRPTMYGLEMHLVSMHKVVETAAPSVVVVDPVSNLISTSSIREAKAMLSRLVDYLKLKEITAICTDLATGPNPAESTEVGISSIMDAWLLLQDIAGSGERNRGLYVLKSRGMQHSNQVREFIMTNDGIELRDVYVGSCGVLTGAARTAQEAKEAAEALQRRQDIERKQRQLERRKIAIDAQIMALRTEYEADQDELQRVIAQAKRQEERLVLDAETMAAARQSDNLCRSAAAPETVQGGNQV
ncbi:circadian clock protein KaiC [Geomonas sp. Red875]|uniref:Circadian clock protein KaiC n=2 Tax=Geomesophilobacter sediminis TaxID=2798584 RepID=A0A8J7JGG4_9BACT|nr:circadian clock protein KaiC [Geomesophilobacter sediminis]